MTKNRVAKVTVCLLTYNHAHLIESTIQSILGQTEIGFELLISDDCSQDGTWERIKNIPINRADISIRIIKTPKNLGMAGNANYAVNSSKSQYIAILHHDDICRPSLISSWLEIMDANHNSAYAFNAYEDYKSGQIYKEEIPGPIIGGEFFLNNFLLRTWGCPVRGTAMIRRSCWAEIGGMREKFGLLADIDLWMRLSRNWDVAYIDKPLILMRHARPDNYPAEYALDLWSWTRQNFLYEIHAENQLSGNEDMLLKKYKSLIYKWRVNFDIWKWIGYGVIRRKKDIIISSVKLTRQFDFFITRIMRCSILYLYKK